MSVEATIIASLLMARSIYSAGLAQPSHTRLLSLVPSDSQLVAGVLTRLAAVIAAIFSSSPAPTLSTLRTSSRWWAGTRTTPSTRW